MVFTVKNLTFKFYFFGVNTVCQKEKKTVQSHMWGCAENNDTKQGKENIF